MNENHLCVLVKTEELLDIRYVEIEKEFTTEIESLKLLCEKKENNLTEIIAFISTKFINKNRFKYLDYCEILYLPDQRFFLNIKNIFDKCKILQEDIEIKYTIYKLVNDEFELNYLEKRIKDLKIEILIYMYRWCDANNIELAYEKCDKMKDMLFYSHRRGGWLFPAYTLTENLKVEVKTNFGYGKSSYFYTLITYKNIIITPFSEWINYQYAEYSEIIRYTKSFAQIKYEKKSNGKIYTTKIIEFKYWINAIEFTKNACNCSLQNESEFIYQYVIKECEKMVFGLERILIESEFTFINEHDKHYKVDYKGHQLMEFRGEKISGALDFISKIIEFENISIMNSFIERIMNCNRKIQPLLVEELKIIPIKLDKLKEEESIIKPQYLKLFEQDKLYTKQKREFERQMKIDKKQMDIENINSEFLNKYPEFEKLKIEFESISNNYRILLEQIQNLNIVFKNITIYNDKILVYFENLEKSTANTILN